MQLLILVVCCFLFVYFFSLFYINGFLPKEGEPPFIRGPIPYFGNVIEFARKGLYPYIEEKSKVYGNIFTVFLFGERIHLIADHEAFADIQKKPKLFSMNPVSEKMAGRLKRAEEQSVLDITENKRDFVHNINRFLQGKHLEELTKEYGRLAAKKLNQVFENGNKNGTMIVNLHNFTRNVLYYASSKSLVGEEFNSDKTEQDFFTFDDNLKILIMGFPKYLFNHVFDAKDRVIQEIMKNDVEKSSFVVQQSSEGMSKAKFADIALGILGASQTNTIHGSFWTLYHIIKNEEIKKQVESEIGEKFTVESYEESIDSMTTLNGVYMETMRFHNAGISLRAAMEDTTIKVGSRNYKIREGDRLYMLPVAYQDPSIYNNPTNFDPSRYQGKIPDSMKKTSTPFGGGIHLCPGRYFAINEIKLFCILMLKLFDIEIVEENELKNDYLKGVTMLAPLGNINVKLSRKK